MNEIGNATGNVHQLFCNICNGTTCTSGLLTFFSIEFVNLFWLLMTCVLVELANIIIEPVCFWCGVFPCRQCTNTDAVPEQRASPCALRRTGAAPDAARNGAQV